ncbi:MAG TPA: hypothetical protein VMU75_02315 [Acidimicrobiales bacterium]|nr:hypothetical protein [Acidimicrobiales bacterium]
MLAHDEAPLPQFTSAVRGYDRNQVDRHVAQLSEWLQDYAMRTEAAERAATAATGEAEELRARLAELERRSFVSTPESFRALGERVGRILESTFEAAEELRTRTEAESNAYEAEHERHAKELLAEAERRAVEIRAQAHSTAEEMVEGGRAQRRELEREIAALEGRRRDALAEIERLQRYLSSVLGTVAEDAVDHPAAPGRALGEGAGPLEGPTTEVLGTGPAPEATEVVPVIGPGAGGGDDPSGTGTPTP